MQHQPRMSLVSVVMPILLAPRPPDSALSTLGYFNGDRDA